MPVITQTKHSIQIYCFMNYPEDVLLEDGGEWGMSIPDTLVFRCEMSKASARLKDMQALMPYLLNSLRQGDNAYVHCVTGVSRAPRAAAVISAKLMGITFEQAKYIIDQVRNIKNDGGEERMEGLWAEGILRYGDTIPVAPTGFSCRSPIIGLTRFTLHATTMVNGRALAICHAVSGATGTYDLQDGVITARSIEAAARDMGSYCTFCATCKSLLKASLILRVNSIY
jgi:hypothetical protein